MAITTNTTRTLERSSTVLAPKCEATQKNMDKLLADAGVKTKVKKVMVPIPNIPGIKDDVFFVGINGAKFYFQRGKSAYVPEPVMRQAVDCGLLDENYMDLYKTTKE